MPLTGTHAAPYQSSMRGPVGFPLVLGHRGYRARFPENTLLAFRETLRAGADGIECDLQKTADGHYVVIHDPSTERVTGVARQVAEARLDELKALDFGSAERIPTLEELLQALPPKAYLDLELKEETLSTKDADRISQILDASRSREHLMISSFSAGLLLPFRKKGFTVGFLVGEDSFWGLHGLVMDLIRLRPRFLNLPIELVRVLGRRCARLLFRFLQTLGFELLFWTVNKTKDALDVVPSARILVTDEVERILKITQS